MADPKATAVKKLEIEQFFAISLTGKVVVPCLVMAMPLFLFLCEGVADAHARVKAERQQQGLLSAFNLAGQLILVTGDQVQ
jgi:hypothetical protein